MLFLGRETAWTTGLELAILAFEDEPVRTGLTHATMPEDECRVALDHGEGVLTESRDGHVGRRGSSPIGYR